MSFGKRPALKIDRELRSSADEEPADRGKIMLVGGIVGVIAMMALFAVSDRLRLAAAARNLGDAEKRAGMASTAEGKAGSVRPVQPGTSGKQAAPVIVGKDIARDEQGRTSNEIVRYSDGKTDTREFTYSRATGKLERIVTRSRDGKLSITTYTP